MTQLGVFSSEAVVEIRHRPNFRLLDRLGQLSHDLDPLFDEVTINPGSHLDLRSGETRTVVSPTSTSFAQKFDESVSGFLSRAQKAWATVEHHLDATELERIGVRSVYLLAFSSVEEAVATFREGFFEYYTGCLEGIGKPVEVLAQVRFDQWKSWGEIPMGLALRITPIHLLPHLRKLLGLEQEGAGALLIDMDRYTDRPLGAERDPIGMTDFALREGYATIKDLAGRLEHVDSGKKDQTA